MQDAFCSRLVWLGNLLTLPNDKISDLTNVKAVADDKITLTQNLKFMLGKEENILGKGETGYQHFLHFPQCFQRASFPEMLKVGIVWKRVKVEDSLDHTSVLLSAIYSLI